MWLLNIVSMKYIKQFNDYVYYRISRKYFKRDGLSADRAIITLSLFYTLCVGSILGFCMRLFFSRQQTSPFTIESKFLALLIGFGLYFFFRRHYKNRYLEIRERYCSELRPQKIANGILMMVVLFIPLILMVLLGFKK